MTLMQENILEKRFGVLTDAPGVVRLCDATRQLAARYLAGEFGRQMISAEELSLREDEARVVTPNQHCAIAVERLARHAPLRILPEERLVGAAPYAEAARHGVPATPFRSVSHTTIGFERALSIGYRGLEREIETRLAAAETNDQQRDHLTAMRRCLHAAGCWHRRYVTALIRRRDEAETATEGRRWEHLLQQSRRVPYDPPRTFAEAVQALWFLWEFQRLCGNWSGLGRVDKMLGPFLERDLRENRINLNEARELLAHFWIKGCEWVNGQGRMPGDGPGTGDAQFYQNVVLAGVDEDGEEVTNEVTYLLLDVVEELHISDFPIGIRVSERTPKRLWQRIADVQRLGGGIVSIYNEDLVIRGLTRFGFPLRDARNFTNDGCWEVIIPGKTFFGYAPFDALQILQRACGCHPESVEARHFDSFDDLYAAFLDGLEAQLRPDADASGFDGRPAPLPSLLVEPCITSGQGYTSGGPEYNVRAPHAGGLPDTVNSLLAFKKLVFDEQVYEFRELVEVLRNDWQGHEEQRRAIRESLVCYGNGDRDADAMMRRVFADYVRLAEKYPRNGEWLRPPGISTFGREIQWRHQRAATPFGSHSGDILATNLGATPGTDRHGPTALMRSFCSLDFERLPNGVPLELKLHPSTLTGDRGVEVLVALLRTFIKLGGWYLHVDVVDTAVLRDAQKHPEKYPNLSVRISGWSARFATLDREWQEMVIQRTEQRLS